MFCCFKTTKTKEEAPASVKASEKETPRYNGQAKYVVAKTCLADDYPTVVAAAAASSCQDGDLATQRTVKQEDNTAARSSVQGVRQPRLEMEAGVDQGRRRLEPEFDVEAPRSENPGPHPAPQPAENRAVHANGAQAAPSLGPVLDWKLKKMYVRGMLDAMVTAGIISKEGISTSRDEAKELAWRGVAAYFLPNESLTDQRKQQLIDRLQGREKLFSATDEPRERWQKLVMAVYKLDSDMAAHIQHQSWRLTKCTKAKIEEVLRAHYSSKVEEFLKQRPKPSKSDWQDLANKLTEAGDDYPRPAPLRARAQQTNRP